MSLLMEAFVMISLSLVMWQLSDIFPNNGGLLGYILQQERWIGGVVTLDVTPCQTSRK